MLTTDLQSRVSSNIHTSEVLQLIESGTVNTKSLEALKSLSTFSDEAIAQWLNINVKTFRSYKSSEAALKEDLQEHIILLIALMKHGIDVFGNKENFSQWLGTENFLIGKKNPAVYLNTISGIKLIDNRLTAMEYGDNV
jgi:putative toxin-antitoxin system antitoxin component (TIGR02293 family)